MKNIKPRHRETIVSYSRDFSWRDDPNAGFSFDCDAQGTPKLTEHSQPNWDGCVGGKFDVIDHGLQRNEHCYTVPAEGECQCGRTVILDHFTNTCSSCGADYNMSGQRLAPRAQWGEETGESLGDILRIA